MIFANQEIIKIINDFLEYMEIQKRSSHNTIISYQNDIFNLLKFFYKKNNQPVSKKTLSNLTLPDFRDWLIFRNEKKFNKNSTIRAISATKNLFNFADKKGFLQNEAINKITSPKKDQDLPKAIDQIDIKSIIATVENFVTESWCQKRDIAIIFLIYSTGLRISEAFNIIKSEFKDDYIIIFGKGGKQRNIPIIAIVRQKINDYLKICPYKINENQPIFLGIRGKSYNKTIFQKLIREIRKYLQLPNSITPHAFRHSCATHILENGGDLRSIQELLGHSTISTTQKYTKINKNHLMQSYLKSHPRK